MAVPPFPVLRCRHISVGGGLLTPFPRRLFSRLGGFSAGETFVQNRLTLTQIPFCAAPDSAQRSIVIQVLVQSPGTHVSPGSLAPRQTVVVS